MMTVKRLLLLLILLPITLAAQTTREEIAAVPERSGGIYHSYEYHPAAEAAVPDGYVPFYISHFGRHGSRWHASWDVYAHTRDQLRDAAAADNLTAAGKSVLARVELLAADAEGRCGDLSPRGVEEHRGIAERMYAAYPEVFTPRDGRACRIQSRSSIVPRCILSMAAFNERLKELNPEIRITRESSARYMPYLANNTAMSEQHKASARVADSMIGAQLDPSRLMQRLFTNPAAVKKPAKLMLQLFALASITQDVSYLHLSFYDLFTDEELYQLWNYENVKRYLTMGPSRRFGDAIIAGAKPLLRNMLSEADSVVAGRSDLSASLRFAHDTGIVPLLALIEVGKASARVASLDEVALAWSVEKVSPMGANLQLIFFRNPATGDVRVRVLHNEQDAVLPVEGGPYYPWKALRAHFEKLSL